jgi:hypothetical protein
MKKILLLVACVITVTATFAQVYKNDTATYGIWENRIKVKSALGVPKKWPVLSTVDTGAQIFITPLSKPYMYSSGTFFPLMVQGNIDSFYVNASFNNTTRILSLTRESGLITTLVIPAGSGTSTGITSVTNSKLGNIVTQTFDNGYVAQFSVNNSDSATRLHGSGTVHYIPVFSTATDLITGTIYDSAGFIGFGVNTNLTSKVNVQGSVRAGAYYSVPVGVIASPSTGTLLYASADNIMRLQGVGNASLYLDSLYIGPGGGNSATNLGIGRSALKNNLYKFPLTGFGNTAVGDSALSACVDCWQVVTIGERSSKSNIDGDNFVSIGGQSFENATHAQRFNAVGHATGYLCIDCEEVNYMGFHAGHSGVSVKYTNLIGNNAGYNSGKYGRVGEGNGIDGLGYQIFFNNTTGGQKTGIGYQVAVRDSTGSYYFAAGPSAVPLLNGANHGVYIGNIVAPTMIDGDFSTIIGDSTSAGGKHIINSTIIGARQVFTDTTVNGWVSISNGAGVVRIKDDGTYTYLPHIAAGAAGNFLVDIGGGALATRTAAQVRSDIGAGLGTVTSIATNTATGITGGTITTTGTLSLANIPNSSLTNSTISGVALGSNLNDLTATNTTLTFSGSYNGSTARTVGLNLARVNTWTSNGTTFGDNTATVHPIIINTNVSEQSLKIIGKNDNSYIQFFKSDATTYQGYLSAQGNSIKIGTATGDAITMTGLNSVFGGTITAPANTYSTGGVSALGRNNTTGAFEIFTPVNYWQRSGTLVTPSTAGDAVYAAATGNLVSTGNYNGFSYNVTDAGAGLSSGSVLVGNYGELDYTSVASRTLGSSNVVSAKLGLMKPVISNTSTITMTQGIGGIRAMSGTTGMFYQPSSASSSQTITHAAGLRSFMYSDNTSNLYSITNYYGVLVGSSTEFAPTGITNRYGIYQEGTSDLNVLNGATTFGSTIKTAAPSGGTNPTWKLGSVTTVVGTVSTNALFVEVGGVVYKLAIVN